ncbi:hypothetical protein TRICI_000005 [Trichomonascus ciferrii]|uniref:Uncharacterized protein n=1 Tax=Trichomonascus ciferrii TaxID=44093 RepID=A0A642VEN3_9ASCO|nr:hypothetical protein TRICI_000005 [Trichomonascus ciferrii]
MLPATPPERKANPRNKTTLACQSAEDENPLLVPKENDSELRRDFSTVLITSIPSDERIKGIQSVNLTCTIEAFPCFEYNAESKMVKKAAEY